MSKPEVGWIGLGKMGIPMAANLLKAGYPVVAYNRSPGKERALIGLSGTANTPKDLITKTNIIIIMVSDDVAVKEIFHGAEGLLSAAAADKIIINMSTVSPAISREMARLLATQGNHYLDAPVSGSIRQAEDATLVIMVGGDDEIYAQVKPVLESIGRLTMLVGGNGSGNTAKLIINTLLAVQTQGLAEAVLFAKEQGIKINDLITLLNNGAMGSPLLKIKGEAILKENYSAVFALKHLAKDLRLAKDIGLESPLGVSAYQIFQSAEAEFGELDMISVAKYLAKQHTSQD